MLGRPKFDGVLCSLGPGWLESCAQKPQFDGVLYSEGPTLMESCARRAPGQCSPVLGRPQFD